MAKLKAFDSREFQTTEGSLPRKIAAFLLWARDREPKRYITLAEVARAVYGVSRAGADHENSIRRRLTAVNRLLHEEHRTALVNQVGVGVRATVGDEDTARTALPKRMRRLDSARRAVIATTDIIDTRKITDGALRKWVETGARKAVGLLAAPEFERQISMPVPGSPAALKAEAEKEKK